MKWYDGTEFKFWIWLSMSILNLWLVVIGFMTSRYDTVGYTGTFLVLGTPFTVYYWFKLRKKENEANLS